jgi:hypothetical protein
VACSDGFSASTMSLMSGEGGEGRAAVLLMAQSLPVVHLGVVRVMLSLGGD